jgi:hypothetical protein
MNRYLYISAREVPLLVTIVGMIAMIMIQKDEYGHFLYQEFTGLSFAMITGLIVICCRLVIAITGHAMSVCDDHGDDDYPLSDYDEPVRQDYRSSELDHLFKLKDRHR